jgi:hypothetical protein
MIVQVWRDIGRITRNRDIPRPENVVVWLDLWTFIPSPILRTR